MTGEGAPLGAAVTWASEEATQLLTVSKKHPAVELLARRPTDSQRSPNLTETHHFPVSSLRGTLPPPSGQAGPRGHRARWAHGAGDARGPRRP